MLRNEALYETAKFFKERNQSVHVSLFSGKWLNGKIIYLKKDRLILNEEKVGEVLLLFDRIRDDGIEPRRDLE